MRRRYGLKLEILPKYCDDCGSKFTIKNALMCKKGGLYINRHNEVKVEMGNCHTSTWQKQDSRRTKNNHLSRNTCRSNTQFRPHSPPSRSSSDLPPHNPPYRHLLPPTTNNFQLRKSTHRQPLGGANSLCH